MYVEQPWLCTDIEWENERTQVDTVLLQEPICMYTAYDVRVLSMRRQSLHKNNELSWSADAESIIPCLYWNINEFCFYKQKQSVTIAINIWISINIRRTAGKIWWNDESVGKK